MTVDLLGADSDLRALGLKLARRKKAFDLGVNGPDDIRTPCYCH